MNDAGALQLARDGRENHDAHTWSLTQVHRTEKRFQCAQAHRVTVSTSVAQCHGNDSLDGPLRPQCTHEKYRRTQHGQTQLSGHRPRPQPPACQLTSAQAFLCSGPATILQHHIKPVAPAHLFGVHAEKQHLSLSIYSLCHLSSCHLQSGCLDSTFLRKYKHTAS